MQVTILCGIPGAGKTTYAQEHHPGAVVVSADHFFTRDGRYSFDESRLGEAHAACLKAFIVAIQKTDALQFGVHVVVDNTNTTLVEIAPYVALGQAFGATVDILVFNAEPVLAGARNLHGVPQGLVNQMAERMIATFDSDPRKWPGHWPVFTTVSPQPMGPTNRGPCSRATSPWPLTRETDGGS